MEHGKVSRGWLGVQIQEVTPAIAASLGLHGEQGALVAVVTPDSPGARAGLKQGDVILSFNGEDVAHLRDLPRLVAAAAPDSHAAMTVWRNGQTLQLQTTIGELADNDRVAAAEDEQPPRAEALGMHFSPMTSELRRDLHLGKDAHGVVVERVDSGSPADDVGLRDGDVLVSVNQQPVNTPQEAAGKLKEIAASSKKSALLLLNRHGVTQYVGVSLGENRG
jgi:serine protease Do